MSATSIAVAQILVLVVALVAVHSPLGGYMARVFNEHGVAAKAIWADTPGEERRAALVALRRGEVKIVFSVDLFNEGVDVPVVDPLLMLRPTDSALLFLQQLGRGLRKAPGKTVCTVLDFVGRHRSEFRYDRRPSGRC